MNNLKLKSYLKYFNNFYIKSTIVVVGINLILKVLGLIFRISLTRILTVKAIGSYTIMLPSLMLFLTLASFSLSITTSKHVAKEEILKSSSNKEILSSSITIGLYSSTVTIIVILLLSKWISYDLLNNPICYIPLLISSFLIPVNVIDSILKGYFNGINKLEVASFAKLLEETIKIISSITLIYFFLYKGLVFVISSLIISDILGEIASILFQLPFLKKEKCQKPKRKNKTLTRSLLKMSSLTTLSSIFTSITSFLEPIIFTQVLSNRLSNDQILYDYSIQTSFCLPMIITFAFVPQIISQIMLPNLTKAYIQKKYDTVKLYTINCLTISMIISIFIMAVLKFYSSDLLYLIYGKTYGAETLKKYCLLFLLAYIPQTCAIILHSINETHTFVILQSMYCIFKLVLLFMLSYFFNISSEVIILSSAVSNLFFSLIYLIILKRKLNLSLASFKVLRLTPVVLLYLLFLNFISQYSIHFIIQIALGGVVYLSLILLFKIFTINNK